MKTENVCFCSVQKHVLSSMLISRSLEDNIYKSNKIIYKISYFVRCFIWFKQNYVLYKFFMYYTDVLNKIIYKIQNTYFVRCFIWTYIKVLFDILEAKPTFTKT